MEAPLPANAFTDPSVGLVAVSCASAGNCGAVGGYATTVADGEHGLLLTETAGTWATGVEAIPPGNHAAAPSVAPSSVACASAGFCSAVGTYLDSSNHREGLLLAETAGSWATGAEVTPPANANSNTSASLRSVSCAPAGDCTAVGSYADNLGHFQGLLLSETAGAWAQGVEAVLPANAAASPVSSLGSVSCASAGNCSAVGTYSSRLGNVQGLLLSETGGTWAAGVEAGVPADARSNPSVSLNSISCWSAGNCSAVGDYFDRFSNAHGLLLSETAGTWATGVAAAPPANAYRNPLEPLTSVSCASAGSCGAVGTYADSSENIEGLLFHTLAPSSTTTAVFDGATHKRWSGNEKRGASAYDTATVAGAAPTPPGTVTYSFFKNGGCSGAAVSRRTVTLTGGHAPPSPSSGPLPPGTYSYQAVYSGESNHAGSRGACERFVVAGG